MEAGNEISQTCQVWSSYSYCKTLTRQSPEDIIHSIHGSAVWTEFNKAISLKENQTTALTETLDCCSVFFWLLVKIERLYVASFYASVHFPHSYQFPLVGDTLSFIHSFISLNNHTKSQTVSYLASITLTLPGSKQADYIMRGKGDFFFLLTEKRMCFET